MSCRSSNDSSLRTSVTILHGIIVFSWHSRMEGREALVSTQTRQYGVNWRECTYVFGTASARPRIVALTLNCPATMAMSLDPGRPCHPFKDLSRKRFRLPRITPPHGIIFVESLTTCICPIRRRPLSWSGMSWTRSTKMSTAFLTLRIHLRLRAHSYRAQRRSNLWRTYTRQGAKKG